MKGWGAVEQQTQETAAARADREQRQKPTLKIGANNPGPVFVRFLEQGQDVNTYPVHEYKVPDPKGGRPWNRNFTCLTEAGLPSSECSGCKAGMPRKIRTVMNVIQRQRPILRKGQDGRALKDAANNYIVDGFQDEVVILDVGGPQGENFRQLDHSMGGLMSREWCFTFSGNTFQSIQAMPATDGSGNSIATPMSEADFALAANKHNLDEYMKPPSIQEAAQIVAKYGANSGAQQVPAGAGMVPQGQPQQPGVQGNQFLAGMQPGGAPANALGAALGYQPQPVQQPPATPASPQPQPVQQQ